MEKRRCFVRMMNAAAAVAACVIAGGAAFSIYMQKKSSVPEVPRSVEAGGHGNRRVSGEEVRAFIKQCARAKSRCCILVTNDTGCCQYYCTEPETSGCGDAVRITDELFDLYITNINQPFYYVSTAAEFDCCAETDTDGSMVKISFVQKIQK